MSRGFFVFGIWCLLVTSGFAYSAYAGYSPFADGARATGPRGPGGVFIGRGPRHK